MTIDEPYSLAPEEVRDKLPQIERRLVAAWNAAKEAKCATSSSG